ncbi:hypothetical protein [Paraferrimonas sedimenticola]|uniref:Uncharacterized protein n=1 Tax=Paraferrimonas sedimenticola TaxID=375674 RepID=A0AA37VYT2_9GAMM|nr:hypothetical protein [Paraferrimonas sedimenticola]GLP95605.1 hypothetical protein GCM10007895_09110 [Paraferrimonas sedimenticola]
MKYLVEVIVTPKKGKKIEKRPGGPGPVVGRMIEKFQPEATFMALSRRVVYMVVELDQAGVAELMMIGSELGGRYPRFTEVVADTQFPEVVGTAVTGARSVLDGK